MKIENMELGKKYKAIRKSDNNVVRVALSFEDKTKLFVYAKGSKTRGWRMTQEQFLANYELLDERPNKDKIKWEHNVNRVIKTLEKSGLWVDILETYKNLKILGYDEKKRIYDEYNEVERHEWKDNKCYNTAEYDNWLSGLEAKYPFLIGYDDENRKYLKTNYIWELSRATLKSMYFGKWANKTEKEEILKNMIARKNYNCFHKVSYDVSFEYNAEKGKAWYSEEYRGCGNGHYYLALDNNLALFCEDD